MFDPIKSSFHTPNLFAILLVRLLVEYQQVTSSDMLQLLLGILTLVKGRNALTEGDLAVPTTSSQGDVNNSSLLDQSRLWSNGLVPFVFETLDLGGGVEEPIFSDSDMQLIRKAMAHIEEQVPCIRFR